MELKLVGYEFDANPEAPVGTDWDANWLVVHGEIHTTDTTTWAFTEPCLTTWSALSIVTWLQEAVAGDVAATPHWSSEAELLHFTEPNLAFSLQERTEHRAVIRVHFSLEALPPAVQGPGQPDIFDYYVALDVSLEDLTEAADVWQRQCSTFPVR